MNSNQAATIESIRSGPRIGSFRLPRLAHARVEDAMHPGLISVSPETPLREVARVLSSHHIHCLVVTGPAERGEAPHCGLISAANLVRAAGDGARGSFEERTAAELAVGTPPTVSSADHLQRAVELMAEQRTDHLIVLGAEDGRPAGLLSALDIAGMLAWGEA